MVRRKRPGAIEEDVELHEDLECLCAVLEEHEAEEEKTKEDVFDLYTHALKGKLQHRREDFPKRFAKGYEILIHELKH